MQEPNFKLLSPKDNIAQKQTHKIYLIEDSKITRAGLRCALSIHDFIQVAGESGTEEGYLDKIKESDVKIVILSTSLENCDAIEIVKEIKSSLPNVKTVFLSNQYDDSEFYNAVLAGVNGYCVRESDPEEFLRAIRVVASGGCFLNSDMGSLVYRLIRHFGNLQQLPIDKPIEEQYDLTERETEVIRLAAKNKNNFQIAKELNISHHTVKMHLCNIYRKLSVSGRLEAVMKLNSKIYAIGS